MLNLNNKLMLALMLSTSFASKELIASKEDDQEVVDQDQDSDNEEGTGRGRIAGGLGALALLALSGTAYWNKDKIEELINANELSRLKTLGKYLVQEACHLARAKARRIEDPYKKKTINLLTSSCIAWKNFFTKATKEINRDLIAYRNLEKSKFEESLKCLGNIELNLRLIKAKYQYEKAKTQTIDQAQDIQDYDNIDQVKFFVDTTINNIENEIKLKEASIKLEIINEMINPLLKTNRQKAAALAALYEVRKAIRAARAEEARKKEDKK